LAGAEEVHPDDVLGTLRERGDLVEVERRRVRRQDRARLHDLVERLEDLLLDGEVLEHRLDDEVGVLEVVVLERRLQEAHALVELVLLELALLDLRLVVLAHHADALVERFLLHLEHRHRDAGVEEVHRDAAAHRAGADDRRPS
jgi:hypothetical protein